MIECGTSKNDSQIQILHNRYRAIGLNVDTNFLNGLCAIAVHKSEPALQAELVWPMVILG